MAELIPVDFDPFAQEKAAGEFVKKKITDLVDFKPVDFNPFVEEFEQERTAGELAYKFIKNKITNLATLPQRVFEASENLRQGGTYDPGPALEAASLPFGPGRLGGIGARTGTKALGTAPLMREVEERGRSGRPLYTRRLPESGPPLAEDIDVVGIEGAGSVHILQDATGKIRGIYGSRFSANNAFEAKMREAWEEYGPTYGDKYDGAPQSEWNRVIKEWNKGRPKDEHINIDDVGYKKDATGTHWTGAVRNNPELQRRLEAVDQEWMNKRLPYRNAKSAARYFEDNATEHEDFERVLDIKAGSLRSVP